MFPAGEYVAPPSLDVAERIALIDQLALFPETLGNLAGSLAAAQLDLVYRNWSIRQIVHHLADSHTNCYIRFKWALTESTPQIKAYDETAWSALPDARTSPIQCSLVLLSGIHDRWAELLRKMNDQDFEKGFFHPEMNKVVTLGEALPSYVWHGRHHLAQIEWVLEQAQTAS